MAELGTYVLVLLMQEEAVLGIGRLGTFAFPPGYYCYLGSARGPGGLQSRVARHLRSRKTPHWHIDHLLRHARIVQVWQTTSSARLECVWSRALLALPGAKVCAPGFGSSDCRCQTHLVHISPPTAVGLVRQRLEALGAETAAVRVASSKA
jgi:Uri superfamily endonuclease